MRNRRTKRIVIRVSNDEHAVICGKAKSAGLSTSELIRKHIDRAKIYGHADKELWLRIVSAMSNSVAVFARASAALNPLDAAIALAYVAGIHRQLNEILRQFPQHACEVFPSRDGHG